MGLTMMVFWVVVIAAIIALVHSRSRRRDDGRPAGNTPEQALRILDERFAKGDIDANEYAQGRDLLTR